jgi:beta-lactamase class A
MKNRILGFAVGLTVLLAVVAGAAAAAPDTAANAPYDVSYLWSSNVDRVQDYRRKVGYVLGPTVAKKLKVVRKEDRYGLIYMRSGDSASAARVAKSHSRLLHRAGLEDAAPMREEAWNVLGAGEIPFKESPARAPGKSTTSENYVGEVRDLELAVEDYIKQLRRQGRLADDERTGWSVYDFTTGEKLVTINEDDQFQAASLIKPFIAAAFFHRVKIGDFIYGPKSRRHIMRMIHWSDNRSTNWVMRQMGGPAAVQRILTSNYPAIFQDTRVVEYIPGGGKTYRNKASIHDYSRFLYALWNNEFHGASEIKRLMALPGSNRIATGASDIPKGTKVYNKTGSTARLCGDMGILIVKGPDGKSYPYAVVGVIEKRRKAKNYTAWIRSRAGIIGNVSNIVYNGIARRHDFATKLSGNVQ